MSQVVLASVLPIPYPGAFYKSITREGTRRYGLLAQKDGKWMGAIVWEVEPSGSSIHILALAVLLGYRRKGVASLLLEQISVQSQLPITVEVQTENSEALAFYHSLGFSLVETLENYYRFLLEHFVSISLHCIGTQEGELHRGAQAEACQMTCGPTRAGRK